MRWSYPTFFEGKGGGGGDGGSWEGAGTTMMTSEDDDGDLNDQADGSSDNSGLHRY